MHVMTALKREREQNANKGMKVYLTDPLVDLTNNSFK